MKVVIPLYLLLHIVSAVLAVEDDLNVKGIIMEVIFVWLLLYVVYPNNGYNYDDEYFEGYGHYLSAIGMHTHAYIIM